MKFIGAHVSTENGVAQAPVNAAAIGARSFALFTRNPARWRSKALTKKEIETFKASCEELGYEPGVILPHDSYLINLGAPEPDKLAKSREAFMDEMVRCGQLGLTMLNFHPGSHLRMMDEGECLDLIAESLNLILAETEGVKAVIENTAGQGSNLGYTFAQIARIIDGVKDKERVGVCIDTCHTYTSGYDISTPEGYAAMWEEFDRVIGARYLSGMHLNDTLKALGSHVDRHAPIGSGLLGPDFWHRLMNDPRLDSIPLILETPDPDLWKAEIEMLYSIQN